MDSFSWFQILVIGVLLPYPFIEAWRLVDHVCNLLDL